MSHTLSPYDHVTVEAEVVSFFDLIITGRATWHPLVDGLCPDQDGRALAGGILDSYIIHVSMV